MGECFGGYLRGWIWSWSWGWQQRDSLLKSFIEMDILRLGRGGVLLRPKMLFSAGFFDFPLKTCSFPQAFAHFLAW